MLAFGPHGPGRPGNGALKAGSRATPTCETRQDRKVAAVSGRWRVPRERLAGATVPVERPSRAFVNGECTVTTFLPDLGVRTVR